MKNNEDKIIEYLATLAQGATDSARSVEMAVRALNDNNAAHQKSTVQLVKSLDKTARAINKKVEGEHVTTRGKIEELRDRYFWLILASFIVLGVLAGLKMADLEGIAKLLPW